MCPNGFMFSCNFQWQFLNLCPSEWTLCSGQRTGSGSWPSLTPPHRGALVNHSKGRVAVRGLYRCFIILPQQVNRISLRKRAATEKWHDRLWKGAKKLLEQDQVSAESLSGNGCSFRCRYRSVRLSLIILALPLNYSNVSIFRFLLSPLFFLLMSLLKHAVCPVGCRFHIWNSRVIKVRKTGSWFWFLVTNAAF